MKTKTKIHWEKRLAYNSPKIKLNQRRMFIYSTERQKPKFQLTAGREEKTRLPSYIRPQTKNIDNREGEKATNKGSVAFRSISLVRLGCLNKKTGKIPRQREHATYPSIAFLIIRL